MEIERYDDGVPSWVDLGSTDLAKSKEFYWGLFGWNCPEGPPEAGGYSVCDLGGKTVAGLGPKMNPAMPTVWIAYVNVDSADDAVAKASANGGTVFMPPMDVMEAGRMAVFADPVVVIGLWQPNQHTGAQLVNEPGALCWNELITTDRALEGLLQGGVRVGRRGPGPPGWPARLYGVEARREVDRGHDAQVRRDAGRDAAELGRLLRRGRHRRHGRQGAGTRAPC